MHSKINFTVLYLHLPLPPRKWSLVLGVPIKALNSIEWVISACVLCARFILFSLFESRKFVTCSLRIMKPCVNFGSMWLIDTYLDHAQISFVSNTLDTYSSYNEVPSA